MNASLAPTIPTVLPPPKAGVPPAARPGTAIWKYVALFLLTACCQAPDVSYQGIKLGELIAFGFLPFCWNRRSKAPPFFRNFFIAALLVGLLTALTNPLREFFTVFDSGLLRKPYVITVCRLISLATCLLIANFFYRSCRQWPNFAFTFLRMQGAVAIFFLGLWVLSFAGVSIGVIGNRLTGLFNEGGPFGLMYGFLFTVTLAIGAPRWLLVPFAACVVAAQSKAGAAIMITGPAMALAFQVRPTFRYLLLLVGLVSLPFVTAKIGTTYISDWAETESLLVERLQDPNFVLGRVAGMHMAPQMIMTNPLLGVGLGNYSLVRNDPRYRGTLPEVDAWDLPGLGGVVTMLIEGGLIGLILCFIPFIGLWRKSAPEGRGALVAMLLSLLLGVQLYFAYPWLGVGLAAASTAAALPRRPASRKSKPVAGAPPQWAPPRALPSPQGSLG